MSSTYDETRAYVAGEVRAELARQRLPMREVARRLGVTHTWLYRRISGDTDFTVPELAALADLLAVPMEKFLHGRSHARAKFSYSLRRFNNNAVITRLSFASGA